MFPSVYSMPTQISAMMAITHSISMKPKSRCSLYALIDFVQHLSKVLYIRIVVIMDERCSELGLIMLIPVSLDICMACSSPSGSRWSPA